MNLTKLFELQAQLDADIETKHPAQEGEDRFGKKVLALLVELGELGQCWRGFKYWSKDQQARTTEGCMWCRGIGKRYTLKSLVYAETCDKCDGTGSIKNPLLEEYVDCLHFILSIGNDWGMTRYPIECQTLEFKEQSKYGNAQECFIEMFTQVSVLQDEARYGDIVIAYRELLKVFGALGDALGLHEDEIEQAYYSKNKENFARQARGY